MSSFGTFGKPLEMWIHYLALVPAVDPYLASTVSLARSALGGAGVVMVHYTRVQGLTDLPTEVMHVARDVGVRVGFAPVVFAKILPSTSIAVQPSAPLTHNDSCVWLPGDGFVQVVALTAHKKSPAEAGPKVVSSQ